MAKKKTINKDKLSELIFSGAKQITPDTTIEKLDAMYFNASALKRQPAPLYRMDFGENRMYYRFDEDNEPLFYTSVTTLIKKTLPTSPHLITWLVSKGGDGKDEAHERAVYGTFLHGEIGSLLINGTYDLDTLGDRLKIFLKREQMSDDKIKWSEELKKDMLSFAQFAIDRQVEPLAIELCLYHPTDEYAGAIDLVANLNFDKKRVTAIIDIKSGRKGFYESHEIQLRAYKEMWNIHFPDTPVDYVFNWSPKDYRTATPTYNFKDQTDSKSAKKLPFLVDLAKIEAEKRDNTALIIKGLISLKNGISANIVEKSFNDIIKENK